VEEPVSETLTAHQLHQSLSVRDLTDPAQGTHAVQHVVTAVVGALRVEYADVVVDHRRGHPVVALPDNYDHLGYAPDAVTRDARYTRYVDAGHVLRSHTTAMVPPALRDLAARGDRASDVLVVAPGMCWRRDSIDRLHTGTPHQLDLWLLRRRPLPVGALTAMIGTVAKAAVPGARWHTPVAQHPYTTRGREILLRHRDSWVEVGECGLAATHVLERAGLGGGWHGLAMGLGLDRLVMLRKGIDDVRLLRSADPRVSAQMTDLAPYRPVSAQPPVRRDLSLVVGPDVDVSDELLGDRVRSAFGAEADAVESVEVLAVTPYDELSAAARLRLALRPGDRNLLVRMVLRPLDRTLTDAEANRLRDQVYLALHEGPALELAGSLPA
jgi:phenylalanyl-tRNA synthetase alpha chain